MTVIVTHCPGGVVQLFNPDTGKITYKCKSDQAFLQIDAFGGIVKFTKKGAKAIVSGPNTSLEFCKVIKEGDGGYSEALQAVIKSDLEEKQNLQSSLSKEIQELQEKLG